MSERPLTVAITPGEPAGIGPELALKLAPSSENVRAVLVANRQLLATTAERLGRQVNLHPFDPARRPPADVLEYLQVPMACPAKPGQLDPANASYVLQTLEAAVELCQTGQAGALVTGPVHKGVINQSGIAFTGHTEWLAQRTQTSDVVMMLVARQLRVALATTHLPLQQVSAALTHDKLTRTIRIVQHDLKTRFGLTQPRIIVCGLNPHAGEGGYLGREEIEVIEPALRALRQSGLKLTGPLPADTAFLPRNLAQADAVLAMYHDQGLPVIKHVAFDHAVNVTLGLPIIRTSVDHGTALDLAGQGVADASSLQAALALAVQLGRQGRTHANA